MGTQFNLRRHFPSEVQFWLSDEAHKKPSKLTASYSLSFGHSTTNPLDWRVSLAVTFSAKIEQTEIAKGSVTFVGYFDVPETIKENDREIFVARNGASVLYSAARELISNLSARSPHINVTLPITNFNEIKIDPKAVRSQITASSPQ